MRFDLVDLRLFIAVADARSITGGAERAHLALASASARIKGLEEAFAVALFKRGRRGVELTAAGESLLDHARLIMHNVEAMQGELARFASGLRADVQLLANTVGLAEHLPKALATFLRDQSRHQCRCRGAREHRHRGGDCVRLRRSRLCRRACAARHDRALRVRRGPADAGGLPPRPIRRAPADRFRRCGRARFRRLDASHGVAGRISESMRRGSACGCMSAHDCAISTPSARW